MIYTSVQLVSSTPGGIAGNDLSADLGFIAGSIGGSKIAAVNSNGDK